MSKQDISPTDEAQPSCYGIDIFVLQPLVKPTHKAMQNTNCGVKFPAKRSNVIWAAVKELIEVSVESQMPTSSTGDELNNKLP